MKIKSDFVTNSSSSSFIVSFSTENPTVEEIQRELFGYELFLDSEYSDNKFSTREIAEQIHDNMGVPVDEEYVKERMDNWTVVDGNVWGAGEAPNWNGYALISKHFDFDIAYKSYKKDMDEWKENFMAKFMSEVGGRSMYVLYYSDNDGEFYSFMEHGRIFANAPMFVQVSYH